VARFLERHDPVHKITIVGRGRAGGYTRFLPAEDRHYQTRGQFEASIASALGGYAAETLVFGEMSTGAGNDLERATGLARRMVTEYGMSPRLGATTVGSSEEPANYGGESRNYSEHTAQLVDREVRRLVDEAYARARVVIVEQRTVLERLALALLKWETLQGVDLERVFSGDATDRSELPSGAPRRAGHQLVPLRSAAAAMSLESWREVTEHA
jgi:cell division protease FtsH